MTTRGLAACFAIGWTLLSTGCATVVNGRSADVTLQSTPPAAHVTVRDTEGAVVATTTTPGKVSLKRGRSWLRPARYTATFEKPGYAAVERPIGSKFNPWSLGNLVLGGPVGVGVDAVSGALWRPTEATIAQSLAPAGAPGSYDPTPYDPAPSQKPSVQMASAVEATDAPRR